MLKFPLGFIAGATYPFRAFFLLLRSPHLRGYAIIPVAVNFVVGVALYLGLVFPSLELVESLVTRLSLQWEEWIARLPQWLGFLSVITLGLHWLLNAVLVILLFAIAGFLVVEFGTILGSPWYGQLSEQLEKKRLGQLPTSDSHPLAIFQDIWRAILFELKKLALIAGVGLALLLLNSIPGIGTLLFSIGGLMLAATIVCLDFFDSPLERRRLRFRQKLGIVWRALPASASFGLVCLGLISLPFVNLLIVPLCVSGGTLLFCDRIWPDRFSSEKASSSPD